MRGGHGSSRDNIGGGGASDPGAGDGSSGCEDVDDGAVVGVRGNDVSDSGGTDGDGAGGTGRRSVSSVGAVVSGSDNDVNTGSSELLSHK